MRLSRSPGSNHETIALPIDIPQLHRTCSMYYSGDRAQDDHAIQYKVLITDVVKVIVKILMDWKRSCRTNLPQARYTRPGNKSLALNLVIASHNKRHLWSWADQAHLSLQHINQLRHLIEA